MRNAQMQNQLSLHGGMYGKIHYTTAVTVSRVAA